MAMRNPAWHPHLDTQQRFTVVVRPMLALRVMQLVRLAGAGHRGVQQQQQPRRHRRPWAQPHRARPARTRKAARREAGGARAWQPCFTGGHRGAALHVGARGRQQRRWLRPGLHNRSLKSGDYCVAEARQALPYMAAGAGAGPERYACC